MKSQKKEKITFREEVKKLEEMKSAMRKLLMQIDAVRC
jgi:hypothetical protein